eukprot:1934844-Pyramimonas_sp.AAC.1
MRLLFSRTCEGDVVLSPELHDGREARQPLQGSVPLVPAHVHLRGQVVEVRQRVVSVWVSRQLHRVDPTSQRVAANSQQSEQTFPSVSQSVSQSSSIIIIINHHHHPSAPPGGPAESACRCKQPEHTCGQSRAERRAFSGLERNLSVSVSVSVYLNLSLSSI